MAVDPGGGGNGAVPIRQSVDDIHTLLLSRTWQAKLYAPFVVTV